MSRFIGKKLPPHWLYAPSRRQVRKLLSTLGADVRHVRLNGTGRGPWSSGSFLLGYLEHRVIEGAWCFYLCLWGVPESAVAGHRDELAQAALDAIGRSVAECLANPATEVVKPTQLLLWFQVGEENVISKCRVDAVDGYSFSAGNWWASESPI